jgi:hypothetical protein
MMDPMSASLRAIAPAASERLLEANARARAAVDPRLLEPARRRIASLLGVEEEPDSTPATPLERACLDLTEQFVVYVPGVTESLLEPVRAGLGADGLRTFVEALYVLDATYRLQAAHARLFAEDAEAVPTAPPVEAEPAGTLPAGTLPAGTLPAGTLPAGTLPAAIADLHAASMMLQALDPATTEIVRLRCARYHDCAT